MLICGDDTKAFNLDSNAMQQSAADLWFKRACARQRQGDLGGAAEALDSLIRVAPGNPIGWSNRGILHLAQQQPDQAVDCLQRAAAVAPDDARIRLNLGVALKASGNLLAAIGAYQEAIEREPALAAAHLNLGAALQAIKRFDEAIAACLRVIELQPDLALAHNNLGTALQGVLRLAEARAAYERAAALEPRWHIPWLNLGELAMLADDSADAIRNFRECIARQPDCAEAHFDLSLALLQRGEFNAGWQEYEWRWGGPRPVLAPTGSDAPFWHGEPLDDAVILLYTEQGAGDNIQFIRFAEMLQRRGAIVWVQTPPELARLFETCPGVAKVLIEGKPLPSDPHFQLPLLSVPHVLGTSWTPTPAAVPYLRGAKDPGPVAEMLRRPGKRSVGIAWAGSSRFIHNAARSCRLADFTCLVEIPEIHLVSLQCGENSADLASSNLDIFDLSHHMGDFSQTAAILERLDLVISVDTSIPHLAGALAKPVWLLLGQAPDWRWMRDREDCDWYPTMRLFRQSRAGDWAGVFRKVETYMRDWLATPLFD